MTEYVIPNNVNTTLAATASSSTTTLTLASSNNLPSLGSNQIMPLTLNDAATGQVFEIVYVTAISGAQLTVQRGMENTSGQSWSVGDYAFSALTSDTVAVSTGNPNNTFQVAQATSSSEAVNYQQTQQIAATQSNSISSNTTLTESEAGLIDVDASSGNVSITLPSASAKAGLHFYFTRTDTSSNTVTIQAAGSDTIESSSSVTLAPSDFLSVLSNGISAWRATLSKTSSSGSASYATQSYVQNQIYNLTTGNILNVSSNYTLTASDSNKKIIVSGSSSITLTLPSSPAAGYHYTIQGDGSASATVNSSSSTGSPSIWLPDGSNVHSYTIPANSGGGLHIFCDGTNWRAITFGQTVVANAVNSNEAVSLGQTKSILDSWGFELVAGSGPKPPKNAIIGGVVMTRPYSIPSGFTNSHARALTAFSSSSTFNVNVYPSGSTSATTIGTITFSSSGTVGSFTSSSGSYSGSAGDMLTVEAPSTQDSTGAQIAITVKGTYT